MIKFDDSNITWRTLDWLPHISFFVYDMDEKAGIVDVIFKFAANQKVMLHTHHAPYITFVIQGELRFYYPDGRFKEVRRCGSYVRGSVTGEPHMEGGGDQERYRLFQQPQRDRKPLRIFRRARRTVQDARDSRFP